AIIVASTFNSHVNGIMVSGGALARISGGIIEAVTNGIQGSGGATCSADGVVFIRNNPGTVNVLSTGAGTKLALAAIQFSCVDATSTNQGTAVACSAGAQLFVTGSSILGAVLAVQCGVSGAGDTSTTDLRLSGLTIANCTGDIKQWGSSTMQFVGGQYASSKT